MHLVTFERRAGTDAPGRSRNLSMGDATLGLADFESNAPGCQRLGAVVARGRWAGWVVDLNRALAVKLAGDDVGAPEAEADSLLPSDALALLRRAPRSLDWARSAFDFALDALDRYDAPDLPRAGIVEDRRHVRLRAPVPRPGKILGVARNYPGHAAERGGRDLPAEPILFLKAPSAVIGPDDDIALPAASQQVDYEGELAAVIGRTLRNASPDEALAGVVGYCAANDVTARDYQLVRGQAFIGKSCDTFAPLGPVLVTADEIPDPQDLGLRTLLGGELVQAASTKEMIFPVADVVAFASRLLTLEPGDIILTGTPAGVGAARTPPRWLRDGDVVEVSIDRIGRLRNYVRGADAPPSGA
jgi:2-keto-4-pentenoate hydratase/2-oxohepta-3-ene-1,7-dioic acid hydratase in catechol pathway